MSRFLFFLIPLANQNPRHCKIQPQRLLRICLVKPCLSSLRILSWLDSLKYSLTSAHSHSPLQQRHFKAQLSMQQSVTAMLPKELCSPYTICIQKYICQRCAKFSETLNFSKQQKKSICSTNFHLAPFSIHLIIFKMLFFKTKLQIYFFSSCFSLRTQYLE